MATSFSSNSKFHVKFTHSRGTVSNFVFQCTQLTVQHCFCTVS